MIIIYKLLSKKIFKKFPEISGKIRINFRKFSEGNFRTHNPTSNTACDLT